MPRLGSAFDPESAAARKVVHEIGQEPLVVRASSLPISASDLRRRVREGRSIAYRLPEAVDAYIRARRLYRSRRIVTTPSAEWKARRAARAALDKRAGDLVVLDVQRVSSVTDYFLICSGKSTTHLETITEAIRARAPGRRASTSCTPRASPRAAGSSSTTATC